MESEPFDKYMYGNSEHNSLLLCSIKGWALVVKILETSEFMSFLKPENRECFKIQIKEWDGSGS